MDSWYCIVNNYCDERDLQMLKKYKPTIINNSTSYSVEIKVYIPRTHNFCHKYHCLCLYFKNCLEIYKWLENIDWEYAAEEVIV